MMSVRSADVTAMPENAAAPDVTSSRGTSLVRALLDLQRERKWGTLEVEGAGVCTRIYIADGKPVSATGGALSDTLGRLLVREGALTMMQYTAILSTMSDGLSRSKPIRFGEAAIALGVLTPKQVQESLAAQVKQKVARCIALSHSTFDFKPSRDWANRVRRFPSTVEPLILHAAASFDSERTDAILRPETGTRARLSHDVDETAAAFALSPPERRFLSLVDGRQTVRELLGEDEVDGAAILVALALSDHLAIVDNSRPVVEQPPVPELPAPRVSYAEIARELRRHLITFTAAKTSAATSEAARAPDATASVPKSPEHARLIAEAAFQLGAGYLRSNSLARATEELSRAVELAPDAAEYTLFAKWADFANEQSKLEASEKGAQLAALEVSAEAVLEQVTDLGFAHYVLGQVYTHEGDDERALRSFRRAVRLDPELIDADRHVRLLELRKRRSSSTEMLATTEERPTVRALAPEELLETLEVPAAPAAPVIAARAPPHAKPPLPKPPPEPKVVIAAAAPATAPPRNTPAPTAPTELAPSPAPSPEPPDVPVPPPMNVAPAAASLAPLLDAPAPNVAGPSPDATAPNAALPFVEQAAPSPRPEAVAPPADLVAPPADLVAQIADVIPSTFVLPPAKPSRAAPPADLALSPAPAPPAPPPAPLDTNEPIETGAVVPSLYSPRRARRRLAIAITGGALALAVAIGVAAIGLSHGKRGSSATAATTTTREPAPPSAAPEPTPAPSPQPEIARASATASAAPTPAASAAPAPPADSTATASSDDGFGMVQTTLPGSAGHRITFDGHSLGDAPGPFRVRCGWHKVQIGSHGKQRRVQVACGSTTDLD